MHITLQVLAIPLLYGVFKLFKYAYQTYTSPLRLLPGPKSTHWLWGNFKEIADAENSVMHEKWLAEYGNTMIYNGFLGSIRLLTTDTKALSYVLNNAYDYPKPGITRVGLGRILGDGILVVEGDQHKQQRRIMNPAFSTSHIRDLTPVFLEKSAQLSDLLSAEITEHDGVLRTDILTWLNKLTLDIIGLAGFNYDFHSLNEQGTPSELNEAFNKVFASTADSRPFSNPLAMLKIFFPIFRIIPSISKEDKRVDHARATMDSIGKQLLNDTKLFLQTSGEKASTRARDLLSLLVRANTDSELPDTQRMSDADVLAQVPTFLTAGHETTSTATTWALYALTQHPDAQKKLRAELAAVPTDSPTTDELNSLTYLDYVVREVMRLHSPVASTLRIANRDDCIPLKEPFTDRNGVVRETIPVKKGDAFFIPILVINRDKSLWGEDAREFKPERWSDLPASVSAIPAVWSNIMSFLSGTRSCIGYRFALLEMKAILFTLVRKFEFELAVPKENIGSKTSIVQRPVLKDDLAAGNQMPLIIRSVQRL